MEVKLTNISKFLSSSLYGEDAFINNISIDSRDVNKGDLFIAIKGDNYDGHDFIDESIKNGASAIVCNKSAIKECGNIPHIICDDTIDALGVIACNLKKTMGQPFTIGVTGTNGKTSVTKLTAEILKQSFNVSTTIGNFNNDIGLPLSIFKAFNNETDKCVYELGASKKNDISQLVNICEPDMTTLLNVSEAHMQSFGNMENLISTKEEIFSHPRTNQVILNKDDLYYSKWARLNNDKKITTISAKENADYMIKYNNETDFYFTTVKGDFSIDKKYTTGHLPINMLFSVSLAMEAGANIEDVQNGLQSFKGVKGRFYKFISKNKSTVIDDSYNANPMSMKSSIKQLEIFNKDKIFIMGDMGELGDAALEHHIEIFRFAKDSGIKYLLYMGNYKSEAKSIFGKRCYTYSDMSDLINHAKQLSNSDSVILIKASRFMSFDLIAEGLK